MTAVSFAISGLFLAVMIGTSWYGAVTLPTDVRIPLHYGLGTWNGFASKNTGLIVRPAGGALIFAILTAVSLGAIKPNHPGSTATPLIIMPIVLAVVAFSQWRAISLARRNAGNAPGQY